MVKTIIKLEEKKYQKKIPEAHQKYALLTIGDFFKYLILKKNLKIDFLSWKRS